MAVRQRLSSSSMDQSLGLLDNKIRGWAFSDGSPTLTPGRPLGHHIFSASFYKYFFLFLCLFLTLTYLSTSICLIDQFCASVVNGRRQPSTPSWTASSQSIPSKDEIVFSFVVLAPSWHDGTTEFAVRCLPYAYIPLYVGQ